ncbi:hypothetical protein GDO86_013527 [Hymenochirus boettgeri]|uniref:Taste receptor type 2 n=1 Tax=Hymenochirus boettgeri TaxID=247094 RepID=A0A8T2IRQ6_9PIPI|nr:hypothetical protein GDO86_013527 [Hymenochirus boettgeri]
MTQATNQSSTLEASLSTSLGVVIFEVILGSLSNGFMVIVNLLDFASTGTLGPCDSILVCLGLSRFVFLWLLAMTYIFPMLLKDLASVYLPQIMYAFLFFSNASLWFATWLCVFYCVHIVNGSCCCLVFLKRYFDRSLPLLFIVSAGVSLIFSLPSVYDCFKDVNIPGGSGDSAPLQFSSTNIGPIILISVLGNLFPFLIFCAAAWLVIVSLWKHTRKMKSQERTSFKEPSVDGLYKALRTIVQFFFFYSLYVVSFNLYIAGKSSPSIYINCIYSLLIGAYPSMHSVLLIHQNNKLYQAFTGMWQKMTSFK